MKSTPWAQNRIDYVVYHNPQGVRKLIDQFGYQAPQHPQEIAWAAKELIKEEGKEAVLALLELHPDRSAIEATLSPEEDSFCPACNQYRFDGEDNFCGACGHSSFDGEHPAEFLSQLSQMNEEALQAYYQNIIHKANTQPTNPALSEEVRLVWNEVRKRKGETQAPPAKEAPCGCQGKKSSTTATGVLPQDQMILLAVVLLTGLVIGSTLRSS